MYYHHATKDSIGFDRSTTGTDAVSQYRPEMASLYDNVDTCPENVLLWFHRLPWTHRMKDGSTLWEKMQFEYHMGVIFVDMLQTVWCYEMRHFIDEQRWREVEERIEDQQQNAREWRDVCLDYFGKIKQ